MFTWAEHDTFIVGRSKTRYHFLEEVNPPQTTPAMPADDCHGNCAFRCKVRRFPVNYRNEQCKQAPSPKAQILEDVIMPDQPGFSPELARANPGPGGSGPSAINRMNETRGQE